MEPDKKIYRNIKELENLLFEIKKNMVKLVPSLSGICGFDGFIDSFIRMENPSSMEVFGSKTLASAGIATSFFVKNKGDKYGGNGPLFTVAFNDLFEGQAKTTYIGAIGENNPDPVFQEALGNKTEQLFPISEAAHTSCLEFSDGKIMLNDLSSCEKITWERLVEKIGLEILDQYLLKADYISAVNWGKLQNVGEIWKNLALRLSQLGIPSKKVHYFMDLAEFDQRSAHEINELLDIISLITDQTNSMVSFNLKEAWRMGEVLGKDFRGKHEPEPIVELALYIKNKLTVDKVIVHPNSGAACAGKHSAIYVPGPYCSNPLISTGAGDHFGAGCLAAALHGLDDLGILLSGVCTSGYFVRTGKSPSFKQIVSLLDLWESGQLGERL